MAVKISELLDSNTEVPISSKGSLSVRALNLEEMINLLLAYQNEFMGVYAEGMNKKPNYGAILLAAPSMAVDLIAISTGTVGQEEDIRKLPVTVQLKLIATVWRLSVPDPKELRELLSQVTGQLQQLSQSQSEATAQIPSETPLRKPSRKQSNS